MPEQTDLHPDTRPGPDRTTRPHPAPDGDVIWRRLRSDAVRRTTRPDGTPMEHRPRVAVLSCSDARVPPSVVFDRPAGELFVVRLAGNTASPTAVASLEYAVEHLGVELLVVLGHSGCGAVAAALDGTCDGSLQPILEPLCSLSERTGCDDPATLTELNVAATIAALTDASPSIARARADGRLTVRGAVYDLATGALDDVAVTTVDEDARGVDAGPGVTAGRPPPHRTRHPSAPATRAHRSPLSHHTPTTPQEST